MKIIQSTILSLKQKQALFELWNSEYPERICYKEITKFESYLEGLSNPKHFFLINDVNKILGWAFTFNRDEDNWFAIILNSKIHKQGFGSVLLNKLKENNSVLNGWATDHLNDIKKNKEPYISPIEFYTKNGFFFYFEIRIENENLSAVKIRWEKQ